MFRLVLIIAFLFACCSGCRQPVGGVAQRQPIFSQQGQGGVFNQPFANNSFFGRGAQTASNNSIWGQGGGQPNANGSFWGNRSQTASNNTNNSFWNRGGQTASNSGSFFDRFRRTPRQIQTNTPQEYQEYSQLAGEIDTLNNQVGSFDSDNQQLHTEIAGLQQKLQVAADYNNQIKQQLSDSSTQFQQIQLEKQNLEQQLAQAQQQQQQFSQQALQNQQNPNSQFASTTGGAPTQLLGGATVRANNSLLQKLTSIQIPGGQARMDGDVIRVEFPSDTLFTPGTFKIRPDQSNTVQNIVTTIRQQLPQQIIGVEAHWDGTPLNSPTMTHHQLTTTQALEVFNRLVQFGLPAAQLFTMAMGSNRPRHPQSTQGGISPNRRVEIVIYPELYNSN